MSISDTSIMEVKYLDLTLNRCLEALSCACCDFFMIALSCNNRSMALFILVARNIFTFNNNFCVEED